VIRGPLIGHEGVLLDTANQMQFAISVPLLGQSVMVDISPYDLEAA
jgi:hypothetical protein